jgi:translation initiation factor IF-2
MVRKMRVSSLAKELGVPAKEVLARLEELGEYVKSAASTLELPVERAVRASFPAPPPKPPTKQSPVAYVTPPSRLLPPNPHRLDNPFSDSYVPRPKRPEGPHQGDEPHGLAKFLLDEYIVPRAPTTSRRPQRAKYWAQEVAEATDLAETWAPGLFAGMTFQDVLGWIRALTAISYEHAAMLFAGGVRPSEVEWD